MQVANEICITRAVLARMRSNILRIHNDAGNYPQVAGAISTELKTINLASFVTRAAAFQHHGRDARHVGTHVISKRMRDRDKSQITFRG